MKLSELGEEAFVRELGETLRAGDGVSLGVGDDAASIVAPPGEKLLLTVDSLVEGTHFTELTLPASDLGRKAVSVSASDIAAMGGRCLAVLLSLVLPGDVELARVRALVNGVSERAQELGMTLVGGNLARSDGPLVVDVTVVGATLGSRVLTRSGARAGDGIYVTGVLGASACGLRLMELGFAVSRSASRTQSSPSGPRTQSSRSGRRIPSSLAGGPADLAEACIRAHRAPVPRLAAGAALAAAAAASSCMDVSDGLSLDLARLCRASGVSARLEESRLPLAPGLTEWSKIVGFDATELALHGGEDYELLFTAPDPDAVATLRRGLDVPITRIGTIGPTDEPSEARLELVQRDGRIVRLRPTGWDHFRQT